jgi:serine/threonine protein kinase
MPSPHRGEPLPGAAEVESFHLGGVDYTVERLLGRGGMADVYRAHTTRRGGAQERVVIKRLLPALVRQREFVRRFMREANIGAKLKHPNIVGLLDVGKDEDNYCLVMEYVDGRNLDTLRQRLAAAGYVFPPWLAARIIADAASALHYAHSYRDGSGRAHPIVHRDVSPDNIMVTYQGQVKLLDFGVAKDSMGTPLTRAGQIVGKPIYFCPEAARGEEPTPQWDIYSLGAVLYELLACRPPFAQDGNDHKALTRLFRRLLEEEPPPPSAVNPDAPSALEVIVRRAMAKRPDFRYETADDMREELENCLGAQAGVITQATLAAFLRDPVAVLQALPPALGVELTTPDLHPPQGADVEGPTDPETRPRARSGSRAGGRTGRRRTRP